MEPVFEIRPTDDDGAAVYEVRATLVATFVSPDDAEEYVRFRRGVPARAAPNSPGLGIYSGPVPWWGSSATIQSKPMVSKTVAECAATDPDFDEVPDAIATEAAVTTTTSATNPDTGETVSITETVTAPEPPSAVVTKRSVAVERKINPYHPKGAAMQRLEAGEPLDVVALDLGLDTERLKKAWDVRKAELHSMGVQVVDAADPRDALDPDWHKCDRCGTAFNAVKAQKVTKLKARPTLCAACR